MVVRISMVAAAVASVALMIWSIWLWQQGPHLVFDTAKPDVLLWALRSTAVALAALAQGMILFLVIGGLYRSARVDLVLRGMTATVFAIAVVSAVALGLAGR